MYDCKVSALEQLWFYSFLVCGVFTVKLFFIIFTSDCDRHSTNENSQSHKPFIEHRNNIPLKTFFSSPPVAVKLRWNSQMNNYKFFWSASLSLSSFVLAVTVHSRYKISYFHFVLSDFSFNAENFSFTSNSINENSQSHKPFRTHKSFKKKTNHFYF